eukprot:m.434354 g.434354  ORF g.434354 m.434354 type:complete len:118 (+) comp17703_c0_seq1:699-1052(+)
MALFNSLTSSGAAIFRNEGGELNLVGQCTSIHTTVVTSEGRGINSAHPTNTRALSVSLSNLSAFRKSNVQNLPQRGSQWFVRTHTSATHSQSAKSDQSNTQPMLKGCSHISARTKSG